jgi:hypothetical protein
MFLPTNHFKCSQAILGHSWQHKTLVILKNPVIPVFDPVTGTYTSSKNPGGFLLATHKQGFILHHWKPYS